MSKQQSGKSRLYGACLLGLPMKNGKFNYSLIMAVYNVNMAEIDEVINKVNGKVSL